MATVLAFLRYWRSSRRLSVVGAALYGFRRRKLWLMLAGKLEVDVEEQGVEPGRIGGREKRQGEMRVCPVCAQLAMNGASLYE